MITIDNNKEKVGETAHSESRNHEAVRYICMFTIRYEVVALTNNLIYTCFDFRVTGMMTIQTFILSGAR